MSVPTTGLPGANGSLTNRIHRQAGRTTGHWVGIVNSIWPVPLSKAGIARGSCERTAQAVPAVTRDAPAASSTMATTTTALNIPFALTGPSPAELL